MASMMRTAALCLFLLAVPLPTSGLLQPMAPANNQPSVTVEPIHTEKAKPTWYKTYDDAAAPKLTPEGHVAAEKGPEAGEPEKTEGEGEKKEGEGEKAEGHEGGGAATVLVHGMASTIVILMLVFAMASSSDKVLVSHTWGAIDLVAAIFLAVLWYQAVAALLEEHIPEEHHWLCHGLQAVGLLLAAIFFSWTLRGEKHKSSLAVFCGCAAHFTSFASMGFTSEVQEKAAEAHEDLGLALSVVIVTALLMAFYYIAKFTKRAAGMADKDAEWDDAIEDVENDFLAMAAALSITLLVNALICGHFYGLEEIEGVHKHTPLQQRAMMIYSAVLFPCGVIAVHVMGSMKQNASAGLQRFLAIACSTMSMMIAWAFLQAAQWEFAVLYAATAPVTARLWFAIGFTLFGCLMVFIGSKLCSEKPTKSQKETINVGLLAIGLIIGWSWEQCFNAAVEGITEGHAHETKFKFSMAIGLGVVCIPVYIYSLKPVVMRNSLED